MIKISGIMITKNCSTFVNKSLKSLTGLTDEIILVDDFSTDNTLRIARKYQATIFKHKLRGHGLQKRYAVSKTRNTWVLCLDSDEILSSSLKKEIRETLKTKSYYSGFYIPYQNYFLNRKVCFGGENYQKLILFNKNKARISKDPIHDKVIVEKGKIGFLKNKINHYSYQSLLQVFRKFTKYALSDYYVKAKKKESSSLKKVVLYPIHMFYSRFVKDKGYLDGLFRIPLDLGFAYMEFLTYLLLLVNPKK